MNFKGLDILQKVRFMQSPDQKKNIMKKLLFFLIGFAFSLQLTAQTYKTGDAVDILWKGKYYPGKIMEVKEDQFHISYDGYGTEWYEWVKADRLKMPGAREIKAEINTTSNNQPAITAPTMSGVESVYDLELSKNKNILLAASAYGKIYVMDPKTFEIRKELKVSDTPLSGATISHDEKYIATLDANGIVKVFSTTDYSLYWEIKDFSGGWKIRFSPIENKLLISASPKQDYRINDLYLYDVETKKQLKKLFSASISAKSVSDLMYSHDGNYCIVALSNKEHGIEIWDMKSFTRFKKISTTHDVSTIALSQDGKYLASGGVDKKVTLWETNGYTKIWQNDYSASSYVYALHIDEKTKQIIAGGMDQGGNTFKSFDLETGKITKNIGSGNSGCNKIIGNAEGDGVIGAFMTHGDFPKNQWMVKMFMY